MRLKQIARVALVVFFAAGGVALATNYEWIGTGSNEDWTDCDNWRPAGRRGGRDLHEA